MIDSAVAAVVGGRKSQAAGDLAPVGKAPPTEQFFIQDSGAARPDRAQFGELCHQGVPARRDRLAPCRLQRLHLLLDQGEPRTLALNLGTQIRWHLLSDDRNVFRNRSNPGQFETLPHRLPGQ